MSKLNSFFHWDVFSIKLISWERTFTFIQVGIHKAGAGKRAQYVDAYSVTCNAYTYTRTTPAWTNIEINSFSIT